MRVVRGSNNAKVKCTKRQMKRKRNATQGAPATAKAIDGGGDGDGVWNMDRDISIDA